MTEKKQHIEFRSTFRRHVGKEGRPVGDFFDDHQRDICSDGPEEHFHMPKNCIEFDAVVSTDPREGLPLKRVNRSWTAPPEPYMMGSSDEELEWPKTSFYPEIEDWFNDIARQLGHDVQLYLSIEIGPPPRKHKPRHKLLAKDDGLWLQIEMGDGRQAIYSVGDFRSEEGDEPDFLEQVLIDYHKHLKEKQK